MHIHDNDVSCCLRATMTSHNAPIVAIYDARGNGGGSEVLVVEPIVFRDDITIKVDGGALPLPSARETSREFNV